MDRRPLLARRFAEAIYKSLEDGPVDDMDPEVVIDKWVDLILPEFKSDSILFPQDGTASDNEAVVTQFILKYPEIRPAIEAAQNIVIEILPDPIIRYGVHSDPDGCHICTEGQHLTMDVFYDGPRNGDDINWDAYREKEEEFNERWLFPADGPYHQLGERHDLLLVTLNPWLP